MVLLYRTVVVSGTAEGVEGVSAGMAAISLFMQDCGWDLIDDRSAEPGTNVAATHMKYVFSSNGEEGNYPTFYYTLFSGTTTTVNSNIISMMGHTAYDVGTHDVPISGAKTTTATPLPKTQLQLSIRSQDDNSELFMSGDSEMIHIITAREITNNSNLTMNNAYFGRINSFLSLEDNPYPLIVVGSNSSTIITTAAGSNIAGIGGNPPLSIADTSEMSVLDTAISDISRPYNLGDFTSVFFAQPMLVFYNSTTPRVRGIAGTVRNGWVGADGTYMLNKTILTASGSFGEQKYQAFRPEANATTKSIILRKS